MILNSDALESAIAAGDIAAAQSLLSGDARLAHARTANGVSLILWALYQGQSEIALALAESKDDLDIHEAAALGNYPCLQQRVRADPEHVGAMAADGFAPLGLAVFFGRIPCAALLLSAGADSRQPADNAMRVAPIHAACSHQDESLACRLVHLLLAFGADPNQPQASGWTPLHSAAHRSQLPLIALLRHAGADPARVNDAGISPQDLARSEGRTEAAVLLA